MIEIAPVTIGEYPEACSMIGELLDEIVQLSGQGFSEFDESSTLRLMAEGISSGNCWVWVAKEAQQLVGLISLSESFALYAGGKFGTITELYIRKPHRSKKVGERLIHEATQFAKQMNWQRLEVTTPPLPEFSRTLNFYQSNSFQISGGCKLKLSIS